jgi:hypothetical protein|tara:strand:+ start:265 stop:798 length:534 start_codon:yes stop_codon:yes gene_type:complete
VKENTMGRIISVPVESAYVTQHKLVLGSLEWLFWHFDRNLEGTLGPPVVHKIGRHAWIVDGHNYFAIASLFQKEEVQAYVPKNKKDEMSAEEFPKIHPQGLIDRNGNIDQLSQKVRQGHDMQKEGLRHIRDLREKVPFLENIDTTRRILYPPEQHSPEEYADMGPPEYYLFDPQEVQ